ncbi:hypothetical protein ACE5IS_07875 [Leptospira wolffii]|uniref:Uncharacterized protein n=1 Tax=Leptospira wolffii TaxID=409998 RepID=A0ABV5BMR1_9LEPT|nr:hypothetical protein [Leptospira wolffii]EPG67263.1 hypothetical protein LEP1GSC061_1635 [Leptospira wolffii serovar Khorat str. Khorat-H2]TGL55450.1 hypothetical protein EHQ61_00200 [Leptospira wolffii]
MQGRIAGINERDSKMIILTDHGYTFGFGNVEYMKINQVVDGDLRSNGTEILTNLSSGDDFILDIEAYDCNQETAFLLLNES